MKYHLLQSESDWSRLLLPICWLGLRRVSCCSAFFWVGLKELSSETCLWIIELQLGKKCENFWKSFSVDAFFETSYVTSCPLVWILLASVLFLFVSVLRPPSCSVSPSSSLLEGTAGRNFRWEFAHDLLWVSHRSELSSGQLVENRAPMKSSIKVHWSELFGAACGKPRPDEILNKGPLIGTLRDSLWETSPRWNPQ